MTSVASCTYYEIEPQSPSTKDLGESISDPNKLPPAFSLSKPYLSVYASAARLEQTTLAPCEDSWVHSAVRKRARQLAVTMDVAANTGAPNVKLPLYTVTSNPDEGCKINYNHAYVFPLQSVSKNVIYELPIQTLSQDNSQENLSGYLVNAAALTASIAPGGVPAAGMVQQVASGQAAQNIRNFVNTWLSNSIGIEQSLKLLDGLQPTYHDEDVSYSIVARAYDRSYQPKEEPPILLGTLTLSKRWQNSIAGLDSPAGVKFDPATTMASSINVIGSDGVGRNESISAYVSDQSGGGPVEALVWGLSPSQTGNDTRRICDQYRLATKALNNLDQAALLWLAYRQSSLAANGHHNADGTSYACMPQDQIVALIQMGLPAFATPPVPGVAPAPTVPVTTPGNP